MVNKKNAKAVYDFLTAHPKVHEQTDWVSLGGSLPEPTKEDVSQLKENVEKNVCGTTMCAAGAAVWVVRGKKEFRKTLKAFVENDADDNLWVTAGASILGLADDQAQRLFYNIDNEAALAMLKALSKGNEKKFNDIALLDIY